MHSKKPAGQQWSIRAEFTVVPEVTPPKNAPVSATAGTVEDQSGIRLSYSWQTEDDVRRATRSNSDRIRKPPVEYQKGSLTFTSNPPFRLPAPEITTSEIQDSGYGSDLFSLNSFTGERSPINPNSRKCRSTCSIVLSSSEQNPASSVFGKCGRINSLRCQTPALQNVATVPFNTNFYGCGDPWCHHVNVTDDLTITKQTTDVACSTLPRVPIPIPLCYQNVDPIYQKPYKRDVSIQTSDSLEKFSAASQAPVKKKRVRGYEKPDLKSYSKGCQSYGQSSSSTRDGGDKLQASTSKKPTTDKSGHTSDSSKKSRTIHIDVYCTDTEMEQSDSSSDSFESTSTPQTVFESESVHVSHEKGKDGSLPYKMRKYTCRDSSNATSLDKYDSDIDEESSVGYPSKIDSYSTINDLSSSISSLKSWKNYSLSSCTNDLSSFENFSNKTDGSSNVPKPLLPRSSNLVRKYPTFDCPRKKSYEELCAIRNKHQALGNKIQNVYLGQDYSKFAPRRLNPEGSDSVSSDAAVKGSTDNKTVSDTPAVPVSTLEDTVVPRKEVPLQQSLSQQAFLVFPGKYTGLVASRFGEVVNISKKLGHHTGPAKNPDCTCQHCKTYFATLAGAKVGRFSLR